jgi:prevent-host-death family protein
MATVNMREAKSQLSRLVKAVESGAEKEIVITRNGKPVARIVSLERKPESKPKRRLGLMEGKFADFTLEEFNAPDAEIARLIEESSLFPPEDDE